MTLDTIWKAHWPGFEACCVDMDAHSMVLVNIEAWHCQGCGAWFHVDESAAVAAYMGRAEALINAREGRPPIAETF